jgi:hypothetical protein
VAVTVQLYVPDPAGILAIYGAGALIRLERAQTEITTLPVVSGQYLYEYLDTGGSSTSQYRTRYSNATNTVQSEYGPTWRPGDVRLYVEPVELAALLGRAKDDQMWPVCRAITEWIEGVTGRVFDELPDTVLLFDGDDALSPRRLLVPQGIISLTTLEVAPITGGTFETVPPSEWFLRPAQPEPGWPFTEIVLSDVGNHVFSPGLGNIRATGRFGWSPGREDVRDIARRLAVGVWRERASGGADGVTVGEDGTRTISRLLSSRDRETLLRYRAKLPAVV